MTSVRPQQPHSLIPDFLRDIRVLQAIGQIVFVIVVLLVFSQLASTASAELRARNLVPGFAFLNLRAGFEIGESPTWYSSNSRYGDAFLVGIINTMRIVSVGLVLTTILGVLVGIFLLSTNYLIRTISRVYVEILRNTPLLVQIFAWYFIVMFSLPPVQDALTVPSEGVTFISLRLLVYPLLYLLVRSLWLRRLPVDSPYGVGIRWGFLAAIILTELAFLLYHNAAEWPLAYASGSLSNPAFLFYAAISALLIAGAFFVPAPWRVQALGIAIGQAVGGLLFYFGVMTNAALRLEISPAVYISIRGFAFPSVLATARLAEWLAFLLLGVVVAGFIWVWFGRVIETTGKPIPRELYMVTAIIGFAVIGWLVVGAEPLPPTITVQQAGEQVVMPLDEAQSAGLLTVEDLQQYSRTPVLVLMPEQNRFGRFIVGTEISPEYMALLVALVVYTSAFIAEIVRAGIQAVPYGQIEAARALGLNQRQLLGLVILPQALRVIIPPLGNQYLNLTKNSSLAIGIGFADIFTTATTVMNQSGQTITGFTIVMLFYLLLSLAISAVMNWVNSRFQLVTR
ncbi:MAG TPA: ABC transporter permease subunit [Spirillospora sp.]|nr:ABC transporter permease subunit [Spirillospora sp.]